jgi:hypothetical protein
LSKLPVQQLRTNAKQLDLGDAQVFHLPNWHNLSHPERLGVMRQIAMMRGRDPRIAKLAVSIFRKYGAGPRDYQRQAAALLKWVQDPKNVFYVNEPGERLQDPLHTIKIGHGDCDDQSLLLCCLFESVGLPWKFVLSGRDDKGEKVRHIEGTKVHPNTKWSHIYCMVGTPPFKPNQWYFCETTIVGVPLGWDVIDGDHSYLPEMAKPKSGPAQIMRPLPATGRFQPSALPPEGQRSPAYTEAYGSSDAVGSEVASYMAQAAYAIGDEIDRAAAEVDGMAQKGLEKVGITKEQAEKTLKTAVLTGVLVSVTTSLVLQFLNGEGLWKGKGHIMERWSKKADYLSSTSRLLSPKLV